MTLLELLPTGATVAQWSVWSTIARVVVTDPAALPAARDLVEAQIEAVDAAASRFRPDSEVQRLAGSTARSTQVSPVLAELITTALAVAARTDGDVDPTVGAALVGLGYDRDVRELSGQSPPAPISARRTPGWRAVSVRGLTVTMPPGMLLDLGATAKAWTADSSASVVADRLGVGALVSLGGDIATAGPPPPGGWHVLVRDQPGDPCCTVGLPVGVALATSSTVSRRWRRAGQMLHHVVDPRTCLPAPDQWRTVSVTADSCVVANALSTAAIVRGAAALPWLRHLGAPARLVTSRGRVLTVGGWPAEASR